MFVLEEALLLSLSDEEVSSEHRAGQPSFILESENAHPTHTHTRTHTLSHSISSLAVNRTKKASPIHLQGSDRQI